MTLPRNLGFESEPALRRAQRGISRPPPRSPGDPLAMGPRILVDDDVRPRLVPCREPDQLLCGRQLDAIPQERRRLARPLPQRDSPGEGKEWNWLPSNDRDCNLTLRMKRPKDKALSILDGRWMPPAVKRVP